MKVRPKLALKLIPILATAASWFGRTVDITLLDEHDRLMRGDIEDDTEIHWVRFHGFSVLKEVVDGRPNAHE